MGMLDLLRSELIREQRKPPVAAVVTVGYSDDNGTPRRKDRFFVVGSMTTRTVSRGGKKSGAREFAAGFNRINRIESGKDPEGLPQIAGKIHHQRIEDAASAQLVAYSSKDRRMHGVPGQRPWCSSADGVTRDRWTGDDWEIGPCPAAACPYLADKTCKPYAMLVFTLAVDGAPSIPVYWETRSWNTSAHLKAFITDIESRWASLVASRNVPNTPMWWQGFPFLMQVAEVRHLRDGDGGRPDVKIWPEVTFSAGIGLDEWFDQLLELLKTADVIKGMLVQPSVSEVYQQIGDQGRGLLTGGRVVSPMPRAFDDDLETCPTCAAIMGADGCTDPKCASVGGES